MFTGKDSCNPHEYTRGYEQGVLDAQKILGGQPTVDAVEVVRCKDCKGMNEDKFCIAWEGFVREDDFCSYGERKDNGQENYD